MIKLLNKEIRLAASPLSFIFIAASAMAFIPGYPILMGSFFVCLGIFYSFQNAREMNDVLYSVLLPIKKTDFVKAKFAFSVLIELSSLVIISAITALRMTALSASEVYRSNALMNATPLYLAFALLVFASFNTFFIGGFFKTAWKIGIPFLKYCIVSLAVIFIGESLHHIPGLAFLNAPEGERLPLQFAALAAGCAIYAVSLVVSCRVSMKRFESTDL